MARANSVKTHSSAPLLVNVNVFVRWLNLTERMQAAQCNWRIVKDWKNSLFTFFYFVLFFRQGCLQFSNSISGQKHFLPCDWTAERPSMVPGMPSSIILNRVLGEWLIWNHHPTHFFAAYWLTSVFCGCLLTNTYTKKLLNSDWLRKECRSSVTRVQTCNTTANYKWSLIGWKHKRNDQEPIRLELI